MANKPLSEAVRKVLRTLEFTEVTEYLVTTNGRISAFSTPEQAETAASKTGARVEESNFTVAEITLGQLKKNVYDEFKRTLEFLGGTWVVKKKQHRFINNPRGLIEQLLLRGNLPDMNPLDFFPTPKALVEMTLNIDWIATYINFVKSLREDGVRTRILEPEAGSGAYARALADRLGDANGVLCLEKNPLNVSTLTAQGLVAVETDFLEFQTDERFHLIVMNPPFDRLTWLEHLKKAYSLLAPNGRLLCIAPESAKECRNPKGVEILRWLLTHGTIADNDPGAFKESGTNINTVTICLEAGDRERVPTSGYPSQDALDLDVAISNKRERHEQVQKLVTETIEVLNREGSLSLAFTFFPDALREKITKRYNDLNDEVLREELLGANITEEDIGFLIESEIYERRLQSEAVHLDEAVA